MNWWQSLLVQLVLTSVQVLNAHFSKNITDAVPGAMVAAAMQAAVHKSTADRDPEGSKL